jgi:hypothetical protein
MSAAALLFAVLAASPPAPPPPGPAPAPEPLTAEDERRLGRGDDVLRLVPVPGERYSEGLAARVLPHDAERVWRAVADVDHWHEWVPFLEVSERQPPGRDGSRWRVVLDLPLPLADRHYAAGARTGRAGSSWVLDWSSVPGSGNVAWARGSFIVTPRSPERSLVVFRTASDFGDHTPELLLELALRRALPWVLEGLAQQVNRCRYTVPYPDGCREEPATSP